MKYVRYLVTIGLLAFAVQARGADHTVNDIYDDIVDIWNTVTGDVKMTAHEFSKQLNDLTAKGQTVRDTVQEALTLIQHRDGPFANFLRTPGDPNVRCGDQSDCRNFRLDLEIFVTDMAALKSRFPHIAKHGLGDGTIAVDVIDVLPPLALFGLYETLNKVPNWQDTPQNLSDLYDEIDDPDAFSEEPLGASHAIAASFVRVAPKSTSFGGGQTNFGSPVTKLDVFCSKGKQLRADPVRLNRVRAGWSWIANGLDGGAELAPESISVTLLGEGTAVPVPLKGLLKLTAKVIESIFASVDAHRANLGLCRQIETDVAQRASLVDYRDAKGVLSAYWVVYGILESRQAQYLDETDREFQARRSGESFFRATLPTGLQQNLRRLRRAELAAAPDSCGLWAVIKSA